MRRLGSRYVLHEPLGRGAGGEVWRGERLDDGTGDQGPVAVKVLRPELAEDPDFIDRFLRERRVLLALDDPHLVKVRDVVAEGGTFAIVMDLVDGGDLRGYLRERGRLPQTQAVDLIAQVLSALAVTHRAGVVHQDVKPANILLDTTDRDAPWAMLTDFGIARLTQGRSAAGLSVTIGTPMYMAPELATDRPAGPAADLYSAGVVLYELLAGRPPFAAPNPIAMIRAHAFDPPPPIEGLAAPLWDALRELLAKRPADRPADALAARSTLATALALAPALAPAPTGRAHRAKPFIPELPSTAIHLTDGYESEPVRMAGRRAPRPVPVAVAWTDGRSTRFGRGRALLTAGVVGAVLVGLGSWTLAAGLGGDDRGPAAAASVAPSAVVSVVPSAVASAAALPAGAASADPTLALTPSPSPADPPRAPVPDVRNMVLADASAALRKAGFTNIPYQYDCYRAPNIDNVVSQEPSAGSRIATTSPVSLKLQAADCATVPIVVGMMLRDAVDTLQTIGFTNISYTYECLKSIRVGTVVLQSPPEDTSYSLKQFVNLRLQTASC
ncbi:serine/threonine protein kinase [Frankia sp. Cas3]|uniref:serine/threonine protein kinase n=1 Tax=Frankia sp. Cas3 TaxID=3073926 RepID=UPI002AD31D65|nr:protein kinase [Frankia sp. Cas3]